MDNAHGRTIEGESEELRARRKANQQHSASKAPAPEAVLPPEVEASALTDPRFSSSANAGWKAQAIQHLQRTQGNAYVQQLIGQREPKPPEEERDHAKQSTEVNLHTAPAGLHPLGTQPLPTPSAENVRQSVQRARGRSGPGTPLPTSERDPMEQKLGRDLSQVRVHTDPGAKELTDTLGARAATIGRDIYVAPDEYRPGSAAYQELLAHEAAHVVQTGGREGQGPLIGAPWSQNEREADRAKSATVTGQPLLVGQARTAPYAQLVPRPFPTDAAALSLSIDAGAVISHLESATSVTMDSAFGSRGGNIFNARGNPRGMITTLFTGNYFQGNKAWASDEFVWDPGAAYAYCGWTVTIELLEDNVEELGAGRETSVGAGGATTATTGTSTTATSGASGSVGGEAAGGGVKGTGSGGASASTAVGTTGGLQSGGERRTTTPSGATVYTSNVYARVTVQTRIWDFLREMNRWTVGPTAVAVGTARYTRPTLEVVSPGGGGTPPPAG